MFVMFKTLVAFLFVDMALYLEYDTSAVTENSSIIVQFYIYIEVPEFIFWCSVVPVYLCMF
jgi:hypothetical protein